MFLSLNILAENANMDFIKDRVMIIFSSEEAKDLSCDWLKLSHRSLAKTIKPLTLR